MWRRAMMCQRVAEIVAPDALSRPSLSLGRSKFQHPPDCQNLERVKGIEPSS